MQTMNNMPVIDVERVKAYNTELKQNIDRYSKIQAEKEFTSKELEKICQELSAELGIPVTQENLRQIYDERVAKVENSLRVGEEILNRIKAEENGQTPNPMPVYEGFNNAIPTGQAPVQTPVQVPAQNVSQQTNVNPMFANLGQPVKQPGAINTGEVPVINVEQGTPSAQPAQPQFGSLPNMFGSKIEI